MVHPLDLPPLDVPALLRQHGLRPDKRLGQNFLVDPAALRRVAQAAELSPGDQVLEIGAGLGSLTRYLAELSGRVIAVELDSQFIPILEHVLAEFDNVVIVQGDILELDPAELIGSPGYQVVANIPYYITSALIRHLLEARLPPERMVLTVQREVALRICAGPGDMSLLALSVQVFGRPKIGGRIPAGAFFPAPGVDSAIVKIDLFPQPLFQDEQLDTFFQLARAGFSQKRKTLRNALAGGLRMPAAATGTLLQTSGIDPRRRAETLSLEEWRRLVEAFRQAKPSRF